MFNRFLASEVFGSNNFHRRAARPGLTFIGRLASRCRGAGTVRTRLLGRRIGSGEILPEARCMSYGRNRETPEGFATSRYCLEEILSQSIDRADLARFHRT